MYDNIKNSSYRIFYPNNQLSQSNSSEILNFRNEYNKYNTLNMSNSYNNYNYDYNNNNFNSIYKNQKINNNLSSNAYKNDYYLNSKCHNDKSFMFNNYNKEYNQYKNDIKENNNLNRSQIILNSNNSKNTYKILQQNFNPPKKILLNKNNSTNNIINRTPFILNNNRKYFTPFYLSNSQNSIDFKKKISSHHITKKLDYYNLFGNDKIHTDITNNEIFDKYDNNSDFNEKKRIEKEYMNYNKNLVSNLRDIREIEKNEENKKEINQNESIKKILENFEKQNNRYINEKKNYYKLSLDDQIKINNQLKHNDYISPFDKRSYFLGNSNLENNTILNPKIQYKTNKYLFPDIETPSQKLLFHSLTKENERKHKNIYFFAKNE